VAPDRLTVGFNRTVDPASLTPGTVTLEDAFGRAIAVTISAAAGGAGVVIVPDRALPTGNYVLRLSGAPGGVSDAATGALLDGDSDGAAGGDAVLGVTIIAVMTVPVARDDSAQVLAGASVVIDVLANDSDAGDDRLVPVLGSGPANGTLAQNADGSFTYTPADGFSGTDSFTYAASDGSAQSNLATVTIAVAPAPAAGGGGGGGAGGGVPPSSFGLAATPTRIGGTGVPMAPAATPRSPSIPLALTGQLLGGGTPTPGLAARCIAGGTARLGDLRVALPPVVPAGTRAVLRVETVGQIAAETLAGARWRVDWGDGSAPLEGAGPIPARLSHLYARSELYRVHLTLTLADGTTHNAGLFALVGSDAPVRVVGVETVAGGMRLVLSRALDPATLARAGAVQVIGPDGRAVTAEISLAPDGRSILVLAEGLVAGSYRLLLDGGPSGLADLMGCWFDGDADGYPGGLFEAALDFDLSAVPVPVPVPDAGVAVALAGPVTLAGAPPEGRTRLALDVDGVAVLPESTAPGAGSAAPARGGVILSRPAGGEGASATLILAAPAAGAQISITAHALRGAAEAVPQQAGGALAAAAALVALGALTRRGAFAPDPAAAAPARARAPAALPSPDAALAPAGTAALFRVDRPAARPVEDILRKPEAL
jgi:hypothetical protein